MVKETTACLQCTAFPFLNVLFFSCSFEDKSCFMDWSKKTQEEVFGALDWTIPASNGHKPSSVVLTTISKTFENIHKM